MLPNAASAHWERIGRTVRRLLYCPACGGWQLGLKSSAVPRPPRTKRFASTLVSTTAVNATKSIPQRNRPLYEALNELNRKAPGQVSLSRLQLALQGLENEHPTIRIALLGLNVHTAARRLVRLLLADSSKSQEDWEAHLLGEDLRQREGLVIRFGIPPDRALQDPKTTLPILYIPAPVLRDQGVEILISSINGPDATANSSVDTPSDALLSPTLGTPASLGGRQSLIRQPVHRAMLVARGIDELMSAVELLARTKFESRVERELVGVILDLDGISATSDSKDIRVNTTNAEQALKAVRTDSANTLNFEKAWKESGMPTLSKWLVNSSAKSTAGLSSLLRNLILSLLEATTANIASQAKEEEERVRSKAITNETRLSLENAIDAFSRQGHAELQSGLAAAWSSRNWRKLAFWKLFWRVDDVPLIVTDLITTAWLPRTERTVYELSGRLKQAGISPPPYPAPTTFSAPQTSTSSIEATIQEPAPSVINQSVLLASSASTESVSTPLLPPKRRPTTTNPLPLFTPLPSLATAISTTRQNTIKTSITTLASSAQQIVLKALTIIGVSASFSALSFLSVTNGSIYESGAVFALGTVYALRQMQKEWEVQCHDLEEGLMREGRGVLREVEEGMRRTVRDAARVVEENEEAVRTRKEALEAVDRAREELQKLE